MSSGGNLVRSRHNRRGWLRIGILVLLLAVILVTLAWQRMERLAETDAVVTATVRQLWLSPESYEGKRVATSGIVRVFLAGSPNEHFVVEQAGQHRVGLQGVERAQLVSLLGALISVEGVLRIEEEVGIYIQVEELTLAGAGISASPNWAQPYQLGPTERVLMAKKLQLGQVLAGDGRGGKAGAAWRDALRLVPRT